MFKIDLHTHMLPASLPDLAERFGYGGWVKMTPIPADDPGPFAGGARLSIDGKHFRDVKPNCLHAEARLQDMELTNVHVQVVSTVPVMFSYWAKAEHTLELARLLNDDLAERCRAYPDRFVGLGTLPMQDPGLAVGELERCMHDLGLAGVQIGSHIERPGAPDWNLWEPALMDVFAACESLGAAVFVHPWDMMGRDQMGKYWLPWLVGMPAETARAVCAMIFGGVFDRFPRLRVCFAHGGGSFPYTIGRIEHGYNSRPDIVAVDCASNPWSYLADYGRPARFWVDSAVYSRNALRYLIAMMDERRVAMGSDYPFPLGEARPGAMIDSMYDLTDKTKRQLLSGSALEFLNLDASRFPALLEEQRADQRACRAFPGSQRPRGQVRPDP
ncbi:MAG: 2-hydroxy-3-carboxy-6-oxo-7-methylocta-2,4-dienoate decarboxylase [Phycisphaerales bacterium]|nr:MAG: 2-hydroxy-3-carboxy-6-oxo-7-methylocta-2,4-dienoate decarboxylase [Phycisphaerales bacterium]